MEKGKRTVIRLLIFLISYFCIDGGRSLLLINDNGRVVYDHELINDSEVPHEKHFVICTDDEKWVGSSKPDLSCSHLNLGRFFFTLNSSPREFSGLIWQPPETV